MRKKFTFEEKLKKIKELNTIIEESEKELREIIDPQNVEQEEDDDDDD